MNPRTAYVPQSVYVFGLRDDLQGDFDRYRLEYVLGVLNSRVMLYYFLRKTGEIEWRSFPRWTLTRVTDLPVRAVNWNNRARLSFTIRSRMRLPNWWRRAARRLLIPTYMSSTS